jgi:hypothetical protein
VNTLLLAVLNQVIALEHGVALNLIGSRNNTSGVNQSLELWGLLADVETIWAENNTNMLNRMVRDTDGAGLALGELGHGWHRVSCE